VVKVCGLRLEYQLYCAQHGDAKMVPEDNDQAAEYNSNAVEFAGAQS
jgi:hypothetical protein